MSARTLCLCDAISRISIHVAARVYVLWFKFCTRSRLAASACVWCVYMLCMTCVLCTILVRLHIIHTYTGFRMYYMACSSVGKPRGRNVISSNAHKHSATTRARTNCAPFIRSYAQSAPRDNIITPLHLVCTSCALNENITANYICVCVAHTQTRG